MAKKQETNIQDHIRLALSKRGCKVFRCNVGNFYTKYGQEIKIGTKGHSDVYGVRPDGKAFFIEIKTPIRKSKTRTIEIYRSYENIECFSRICAFCRRCDKNSFS